MFFFEVCITMVFTARFNEDDEAACWHARAHR
jgi:hypothetical protein